MKTKSYLARQKDQQQSYFRALGFKLIIQRDDVSVVKVEPVAKLYNTVQTIHEYQNDVKSFFQNTIRNKVF